MNSIFLKQVPRVPPLHSQVPAYSLLCFHSDHLGNSYLPAQTQLKSHLFYKPITNAPAI